MWQYCLEAQSQRVIWYFGLQMVYVQDHCLNIAFFYHIPYSILHHLYSAAMPELQHRYRKQLRGIVPTLYYGLLSRHLFNLHNRFGCCWTVASFKSTIVWCTIILMYFSVPGVHTRKLVVAKWHEMQYLCPACALLSSCHRYSSSYFGLQMTLEAILDCNFKSFPRRHAPRVP